MNFVGKLGIFAFVIAGGMIFAAEKFNMPQLIPLALGLFGLFGIALGIETIASGKIEMFNRLYSRRENFTGLPARLFGVMILLFGALVLAHAFYEWTSPGAAGNFLAGLVGSSRGWGVLLITFGFFTLLFGLIRLIAGSAHRPEERSEWTDFGYRARGLVNLIVGLVALTAGVWLIFK
ncbi:MAG: hypothetical protein JETCAE02_00080 [Anaerolineaceae bacterium]|nr:hypothetical protein [Anaerolineae bacterium]MBL1172814.1 hypothetical protein [Chloroflexota bacterium]MCL4824073.1 hypothetical protein [Anaerolineales bacterium]MDL1927252.1 hypothetical protein [Anaerolineae bacterium AMX1]GJQ37596.1 MAG: hypothetical protein JETCAE02_00080 [Anaerolineaceae bacterium]